MPRAASRAASRFLVATLATLMATAWLSARPTAVRAAEPSELFFSEYIEGSSNNKALEIYNGTGSTIDLATGGYDVQMFFNGAATAGLTIALTGTVASGDVYVVAQSSANATILAQADQTSPAGWFNGDDAVVLRKGGVVIDSLGQIGFDPGSEWGTALTSTADNTLRRDASVCAGDPSTSDAYDPAVEWIGFATDTVDGLGAHTAACSGAPALSINDISFNEGGPSSYLVSFTISLSAAAGAGGVTFDVATADGTATEADNDYIGDSQTELMIPAGQTSYTYQVVVNGDDNPEQDEDFFVNVTNVTGATVADGQGKATIRTDDAPNACESPFTPIYDIQGSGLTAAITGTVTTRGIVVGDLEGAAVNSGFFIQDVTGDGVDTTSDGIFVQSGTQDLVSAGDDVVVTGFAREQFGQTTINGSNADETAVLAANVTVCGTGSVGPTDVTMPFSTLTFPERYEGMLVRFPQTLQIAEYFNYDRFGEIVLALPIGEDIRPFTGTALEEPGADANARTETNTLSRITLDDNQSAQNPSTLRHPNGEPFSLSNRFRGGDEVTNTIGVLGFGFSLYRIFPTQGAQYTATNPRPSTVPSPGGRLRVAAQNTLNFFVTADYPTGNPLDNKCGPGNDVECRGWDFDQPNEFTRQRDKLLQALIGIDADVLGLNELENSTGVEPLESIVGGLNGILGDETYAYIHTGTIGTDAIKVGLIYKPDVVTPVGDFELLTTAVDPRFIDTKSRPALAQTFQENATGERFTVVVNHLKSKGSDCNDVGDPDLGDGQGNCSQTRRAAAEALVDWLATDPTGSGDPDFLIVGDLNSYAKEQTIDEIKQGADDVDGSADDWTNLIERFIGTQAYSYVFDGQAGYLDHALSNATLTGQVTGATEWHINADEPDVLDYDTSFKPPTQDALYEPNQFRTSDHDPVLVGLDLNAPPVFSVIAGGTCATLSNGGSFLVTVSDLQTAAGDLTLALTGNTNPTLVPNVNVSISGSATRTISIAAENRQSGTATLTFSLSDGVNTVTFDINVQIGTDADDTLTGTDAFDFIVGGQGIDTISGGAGGDVLCGGLGNDTLAGGDGADSIDGGFGDDILVGDAGDDALSGNLGADTLTGGTGADAFSGGLGADVSTDFNAGEGDTSDGT